MCEMTSKLYLNCYYMACFFCFMQAMGSLQYKSKKFLFEKHYNQIPKQVFLTISSETQFFPDITQLQHLVGESINKKAVTSMGILKDLMLSVDVKEQHFGDAILAVLPENIVCSLRLGPPVIHPESSTISDTQQALKKIC